MSLSFNPPLPIIGDATAEEFLSSVSGYIFSPAAQIKPLVIGDMTTVFIRPDGAN